ncbi:WD40-repeat-containing domain protein [Dipodascopsis uninucleata]
MAYPTLTKRSSFSILTEESQQGGQNFAGNAGQSSPGYYHTARNSTTNEDKGPAYHSRRSAYFESHWPLYSIDWSRSSYGRDSGRIAVATCTENSGNKIQILQTTPVSEQHASGQQVPSLELRQVSEAGHPYPCTRILWDPARRGLSPGSVERLATAGDFLRIWEYDPDSTILRQRSLLANKTKSDYTAPLTSLDWNSTDNSLVITSSIDTTCTIWDLNTSVAKTQLIAHDKEVFDARFTAGNVDVFASVGADGSVRVFDLRSLEHSTIIYEPVSPPPLLRISTNSRDANLLATFAADSTVVHVLDIRSPGTPVVELDAHVSNVNAVEWAPQQRNIIATAADDCQVLVWDVSMNRTEIALAYTEQAEVNNIAWSTTGDWLAAVAGRGVQAVRL